MTSRRRLLVATRNVKKRRELEQLLSALDCAVLTLEQFPDCPEVAETGATFEENAVLKATAVAAATGELTLGDDSGLEVDALGGAPGVLSARYAAPAGAGNSSDADNMARLLRELRDVPPAQRTARFVCCIALALPDRLVGVVRGTVEGFILSAPVGTGGFGYDPVFYYPPLGQTFAEIDAERKHAVSHRGKALAQLPELLRGIWT